MALTISSLKRTHLGDRRQHLGVITFDSSYATGGESLVPTDVSLHTIDSITFEPTGGYSFEYDYTNQKVKVNVPGVAIAAAGAATIDDFALTGTGASTARSIGLDSASTSPVRFGPQQEVASTVNLSAITTRFRAIGT